MEYIQGIDYKIIDSLIENNERFALYRLARQKDINLILQTKPGVIGIGSFSDLNNREGFVIAPFRLSPEIPVVLIQPDVKLTGGREISGFLSDYSSEKKNTLPVRINEQSSLNSFGQYKSVYNVFHTALKANEFQKVVLSRTFDVNKKSTFSAGLSFLQACGKYDANFVFLCNTPETGAWMGVSPELLVSEKDGIYKTVALAGTRKLSTADWDEKNRKEQQIVVDYMQQQLNRVGHKVEQRGPFTAQVGNIEHLKTKFTFELKKGYKIGDLLGLLHPSPAVCGFPKESAFEFISENESYDRRYYSGFVGPLNVYGESRLYVNLRCMQIGDDMLRLYAGGGMLPSSELKSEWEETENKLQTILSILN